VASKMIAVTASQRLMSQRDRGKFMTLFLNDSVVGFYYCVHAHARFTFVLSKFKFQRIFFSFNRLRHLPCCLHDF